MSKKLAHRAMVAAYIDALRSVLASVSPVIRRGVTIECRHFFTGAAAYANGSIFMTLTTAGLALKLPQNSRAEMMRKGGKPLRYFLKGPVKKEYVLVPVKVVRDTGALATWVAESVTFTLSAAKKPCRAASECRPRRRAHSGPRERQT